MNKGTVLLIPGFSGTQLLAQYLGFFTGGFVEVWLSYLFLAAGGWRWMGLQADGVTPSFPGLKPLIPQGPLNAYYGTMVARLSERGWNVVGASLDWRQQIATDAGRLADQIGGLASDAPIHLVAHSRGGLVVRRALALLRERGQLSLLGRVVGLGVPHYGSMQGSALISSFNPYSALIARVAGFTTGILDRAFISGDWRAIFTSWPGSYELQPAFNAPGLDPSVAGILYSPAAWEGIGRSISANWLTQADVSWHGLPPAPSGVPWLDVVGMGTQTPTGLLTETPPRSYADLSFTDAGDGVVPAAWATQFGNLRVETTAGHSEMVYDAQVLSALDAWLSSGAVP